MSKPRKIEEIDFPYPLKKRLPITETHPEIADCWYYKKNCGFGPEDFSYGSETNVWWQCDEYNSHTFQAAVKTRVKSDNTSTRGCPYCAGQKVSKDNWLYKYKEISKEFHPTKNNPLTPKTVVAKSGRKIWWLCKSCGHEWIATPHYRTQVGAGCKRCNLGEPLDLRKFPKALKMFDRKRNKNVSPSQLTYHEMYWWQCSKAKDHKFKAGFYKHRRDTPQCPFCTDRRPSSTNRLSNDRKLASQFHPTKNGKLKPRHLRLNEKKKVWWKCDKGPDHVWKTTVNERSVKGRGCPFCSNKKLSKTNCLAAYPKIAREWHPTKNGDLTPKDVLATSIASAFWLCSKCGLEWQVRIMERVKNGADCMECRRMRKGKGKMGPKQKAKILKDLKRPHTVKKLANKHGVHIMTIYRMKEKYSL